MKLQTKVIRNTLSDGVYPVFYKNIKVGDAKVINETVEMVIDTSHGELIEQLLSKKLSVTSVGTVDFSVLNASDIPLTVEAETKKFIINDLPSYIPYTSKADDKTVI